MQFLPLYLMDYDILKHPYTTHFLPEVACFNDKNFQAHFVEMDPWVVSDVLRPNLKWTEFLDFSVIHTVRVENFIERAEQFVGMYCFSLLDPFDACALNILIIHCGER